MLSCKLLHTDGVGRIDMHARSELIQLQAMIHREDKFVHRLSGSGADDIGTQNSAVAADDYLHEAFETSVRNCAVQVLEFPADDLHPRSGR